MALPAPADGSAPGYFGVYPAFVTDIVDEEQLGRIEVRFPWLSSEGDRDVRAWATLCTPYADDNQGLAILPEVGSQVVVAFEAGNWRRP
ncbi:MAG: phage baseplate assembly protein V, partial [Pseudonocardiaceae bacterium]